MTTDLVLDKTTVASADDAVTSLVMNQILEKAPPVVSVGLKQLPDLIRKVRDLEARLQDPAKAGSDPKAGSETT